MVSVQRRRMRTGEYRTSTAGRKGNEYKVQYKVRDGEYSMQLCKRGMSYTDIQLYSHVAVFFCIAQISVERKNDAGKEKCKRVYIDPTLTMPR